MPEPFVEIRGEVPHEYIAVLDAVAQSIPGASRMSVLREILKEWCEREIHRATLVQRCTRGNGTAAESERKRDGRLAA